MKKFILGIILGAIVLSMFGCTKKNVEITESGQLEVTLYISDDNTETYKVKYDKKEGDFTLESVITYTYFYNDIPVAMYCYNGNSIWLDEDMDGYETMFTGNFLIKETK